MRLADALTCALRELGVRFVFGVSGANIEHFHDAIHRLGKQQLRSVLAKSEAGAAFMADCHARVHRELGVCCSTSGGGMLNLAVGIGESFAESVPLLAIVGQPPQELEGRGAFQDSSGIGRSVDAERLFASMSKCVCRLDDPLEFWTRLERCVGLALTGRPGPVVLLVPRSCWELEVGPVPVGFVHRACCGGRPALPSAAQLEAILARVRSARRPAMIIGHGVRRSRAGAAVVEFAQALDIPVATTMSARAAFPNHDPRYLGVVGVAGHPSAHAYLRDHADLILVAGAGLNIMTRAPLLDARGRLALNAELIVINVDPEAVARASSHDGCAPSSKVEIIAADVGESFRAMLRVWRSRPFMVSREPTPRREYLPQLAAELPEHEAVAREHSSLRQREALALLSSHLPKQGHVLYDAGNCAAAALHWLDVPAGSTATIALGMGGMGYALAGAIGAQLGSEPGAWTVAFVGDGAALIAGLEIHTAVELRLPILYVIFNNAAHGMCVTRQQALFAGRIESARYSEVDFATLARSLATPDRLWAARVSSLDELRAALDAYGRQPDRPGVLELRITREELPPFLPLMPAGAATRVAAPNLQHRDEP